MSTRVLNNIKLGIFVLSGLFLLILALYLIGRDTNLFGHNFELKARFENVQGLTAGNNIRYSGIQAGTVKKIRVLTDTLIEITMLIEKKMKPYIHKNDIVSISTDGLMGNKLLNITPAKDNAMPVEEGDILVTKKIASAEEMMETLDKTNKNLAIVSEDIKNTVQRINKSQALWKILDDATLPDNLKTSLANIRKATVGAGEGVLMLNTIISDIKSGKGSLGVILRDTALANNLNEAIARIQSVGKDADTLAAELNKVVKTIQHEVNNGKGTITALLKDTAMVVTITKSLHNIQKGTDGFNQVMEALKHNFFLRGYFRKQEKQQQKEAKQASASQ